TQAEEAGAGSHQVHLQHNCHQRQKRRTYTRDKLNRREPDPTNYIRNKTAINDRKGRSHSRNNHEINDRRTYHSVRESTHSNVQWLLHDP
ncbi:unnamed protein product, partial [Ectocarpus sp. 8 AP-2014]